MFKPKIMRKSDVELLEVRLEPLQTARDRHNESINANERQLRELAERVKDLERNGEAHATSIAQGLSSIRSLLQRANRAARDQGMVEEEGVAEDAPVVNVQPTRDDIIRAARQRHVRGSLL